LVFGVQLCALPLFFFFFFFDDEIEKLSLQSKEIAEAMNSKRLSQHGTIKKPSIFCLPNRRVTTMLKGKKKEKRASILHVDGATRPPIYPSTY